MVFTTTWIGVLVYVGLHYDEALLSIVAVCLIWLPSAIMAYLYWE